MENRFKTELFMKIFLIAFIFILHFSSAEKATAQGEITFPVDSAGISAYVKINNSGSEKMTEALYFAKDIIENEDTHIIISVESLIKINSVSGNHIEEKVYPLLYLNADGWMAAYFPKENPASKIMQWTDYSPGNMKPNLLEEVIEKMTQNINTSYSENPKYYHFQYPEANRITLIAETVHSPEKNENSFSVTVPEEIYEASYSFYYSLGSTNLPRCRIIFSVDNQDILSFFHDPCRGKKLEYTRYETDLFRANTPHLVALSLSSLTGFAFEAGAATVFIYRVN